MLVVESQSYAFDASAIDVDVVRFKHGAADGSPDAVETATALYEVSTSSEGSQ